MLTVCDIGLTPEEVETLDMSPACSGCGHRYAFHERETGFLPDQRLLLLMV